MPEAVPACAAWQEHLAGWLVAQLEPADEVALLEHLDACSACRAEADSLLVVAAVSLGADPAAEPWRPAVDESPPPDLADRIVAQVAGERRVRWGRRAAVVLVGAAAVLVAVVALGPEGAEPLDGEPVVFALKAPGVDASAVVAPEGHGSIVELTAVGLDPEVTYALWLTPPGGGYPDRVPAGTFRPDADGTVDVRLRSALPPDEMGRVWATTPDREIALDTEPPD
jgi:hypothetical protein